MNALVLAFDTSTEVCAAALGSRRDDSIELLASADFEAPRAAMSRLLPSIADLLDEAGVKLSQLTDVVVGRGPGSFTGVRIGVATAKGLAHGLGVPLYGVGTLDAVAWAFSESEGLGDGALLGVVGDAMRGEVYPALFRFVAGRPVRLSADRVARPDEAAAEWASLGQPLVLAGNGLAKHECAFVDALGERVRIARAEQWAVSGVGLMRAYSAALRAGEQGSGDVGGLLPLYTRLSDAEQAEQERQGRWIGGTPESGVYGPGDRSSGHAPNDGGTGGDVDASS